MSTETMEAPTVKTNGISKLAQGFRDGAGYEKDGAGRLVPKGEEKTVESPKSEKPPVAEIAPDKVETPPATEKPVETKAEPLNDGLAQGLKSVMTPKKAEGGTKDENMANLRKLAEERQKRIEELEAAQKTPPPDYEELKRDRELLSSELAKVKVEATPEFKKKFVEPLDKSVAQIKRALASVEANPEEFIQILNMPESKERSQKLSEMVEGMDPFSEKLLMASVQDYSNLKEQRDIELKNPSEAFVKYQEQEAQFKREQIEKFNGTIDVVIDRASKSFPFLKKIEGNEAWNKQVETITNNARGAWRNPTSTEDQAEMILAAQMMPVLYKSVQDLSAELERTNAELAQYNKATPNTSAAAGQKSEGGGSSSGRKSAAQLFREGAEKAA